MISFGVQISLTTVLSVEWSEPRLTSCVGNIDPGWLDKMWRPDISLLNAQKAEIFPSTGEARALGFVRRNYTNIRWIFELQMVHH